MVTLYNGTTNSYYFSVDLPHMDEIVIITLVLAIWVFSIMQFIRLVLDPMSHTILPGYGIGGDHFLVFFLPVFFLSVVYFC